MIDFFKHNTSSKRHQQLARAAAQFQELCYEPCPDESEHCRQRWRGRASFQRAVQAHGYETSPESVDSSHLSAGFSRNGEIIQ